MAQGLAEVAGVQVPAGCQGCQGREEVVDASGRQGGLELVAAFAPGAGGLSGGGGNGQASTVAAGLVVVPDQGGLVLAGFQALPRQGHDLVGAPAGVPEQDVQGLVHQLQVVRSESALAAGPALS